MEQITKSCTLFHVTKFIFSGEFNYVKIEEKAKIRTHEKDTFYTYVRMYVLVLTLTCKELGVIVGSLKIEHTALPAATASE